MSQIPIHNNISCKGLQLLIMSISVLALLLLSACSSDISDLEQMVAETKARENPNVEMLPKFSVVSPYYYSGSYENGDTDPFESFKPLAWKTDTGSDINKGEGKPLENCPPLPNANRVRATELERLPLDTFQMQGTLRQGDELYGLVVSKASGNVHQVQIGDFLGQYHGQIISISTTEIAVEEYIPNGQRCYDTKVNTIARQR